MNDTTEVWGIWCTRSASSVLGALATWAKEDGRVIRTTEADARAKAAKWNRLGGINVGYAAKRMGRFVEDAR